MRPPRTLALGLLTLPFCLSTLVAQAPFTAGNLVVVRVGDGSAALTNAATPMFLEEMTTAGTPVQTVAMPTVTSGSQRRYTNSGSATSEGFLGLSVNGRYLVAGGYDAALGTTSVATTASATNPRVVARIDLNGPIDTSTALGDAYSGGNIRSVATDDGSQFWTSGTASTSGGVRYAQHGATASTQLSTTVTNTRVVGIDAGQLYVSSATAAFPGVSTVGNGIPTTPGQVVTLLPGFPTTTGPSSYDFFFADPNTLYVADDRTAAGIEKWTYTGAIWVLQYALTPPTTSGCRGLTGVVHNGIATLYATAAGGNQVVTVTDTGAGSTFTTLANAPANTAFRGLRLLPARGDFVRVPHGCGPTTIEVVGQPRAAGRLLATLGNLTGQPVIGLGFQFAPVPFCGCTIGHDWTISVLGGSLSLTVPNSRFLVGLNVGFQGVDAFGAGGCASPRLTLTDTIVVTIG